MSMPLPRSIASRILVGALLLGMAGAGHAEIGDYKWWEVLKNLITPPGPDNAVRPDERRGDFPLRSMTMDRAFDRTDWYRWQAVTLAPETGAACGNGTPFTFFVNLSPTSRNAVIAYEHGGACWDTDTCTNPGNPLGAANPDGISPHYFDLVVADPASGEFSLFNRSAVFSVLTPFTTRTHPEALKTRHWNHVYVPYCTGDVHAGRSVAVYKRPDGTEMAWHHVGANNARAVAAWMRDHLQRPRQLAQVGCSAGSTGATVNYHHMREALAPDRSFLVADSGQLFPAPAAGDPSVYPSIPLHRRIRSAWSLDDNLLSLYERALPGFSRNDVGGIHRALSKRWPDDRLGLIAFWRDGVYSNYSYRDQVVAAGISPDDRAAFVDALLERRTRDMMLLRNEVNDLANVGTFLPQYRQLMASHCATLVDWRQSDIQERGARLREFIDDVFDGTGAVGKTTESDPHRDLSRDAPLGHQVFNWLVGGFVDWFRKGIANVAGVDTRLGRLFDGRTGLPWVDPIGSGGDIGPSDSGSCGRSQPKCANGEK